MEELKYPIGKFQIPSVYDEAFITQAIQTLAELPSQLRAVLSGVSADKLIGKYRPDGWSVRQVVHHLADSHMNCLVRFKLGLTEDHPTIKPYNENLWAHLVDANNNEIESSLLILEGVHARLVTLLKNFKNEDWERLIHHPESKRDMSLKFLLALYSWHSKHHLGHIKNALSNPY